MSLSITIDLSDADLAHFQDAITRAQQTSQKLTAEQITGAAKKLSASAVGKAVPAFIGERLGKLDALIAMVEDVNWALQEDDMKRVLTALSYFAEPDDVIPDTVPVVGYLDDAIMIELCVRELKHELDAYQDFCDFRKHEAAGRGLDPNTMGKAEWLEGRRVELQERMRRRRNQSGFSSATGAFRIR